MSNLAVCGPTYRTSNPVSRVLLLTWQSITPEQTSKRAQELTIQNDDLGSCKFACECKDGRRLCERKEPQLIRVAEDTLCLAEVSTSIRIVDATYSPYGLSADRARFVAILTADRRCAVYGPTKDPDVDKWQIRHDLLQAALQRLGHEPGVPVEAVDNIRRLRISSIAWTPPCFGISTKWGHSMLLTGTEAGELQFHHITNSVQNQIHVMNCSDHGITRIRTGHWSATQGMDIFLSDSSGCLIMVTFQISYVDGALVVLDNSACRYLEGTGLNVISNLACAQVDADRSIVAATSAGKVRVLLIHNKEEDVQETVYILPFYGAVSGLLWCTTVDGCAALYILGHTGQNLVVQYSMTEHTLVEDAQQTAVLTSMSKEKTSSATRASESRTVPFRMGFLGVASSPGDLLLAISYELVPIDKIRYQIPSAYVSYLSFILISQDIRAGLTKILAAFLRNPYEISISAVLALHRRLSTPLLSSLDDVLAQGASTFSEPDPAYTSNTGTSRSILLTARLFRIGFLNGHRIALSSGELDSSLSQQVTKDLRNHFILEILTYASAEGLLVGERGRHILERYTTFVGGHVTDKPEILSASNTVKSRFDLQADKQTSVHNSIDVCAACQTPIPVDGSLFTGKCANNHAWSRCSITLQILDTLDSRTCLGCGLKAVAVAEDTVEDGFYADLLDSCDTCYYCGDKWYRKI